MWICVTMPHTVSVLVHRMMRAIIAPQRFVHMR